MIPVALLTELIPVVIGLGRMIRGLLPDEDQRRLVRWANLLKRKPKDGDDSHEWADDVNQFLVDLTTRRGFSPAYQYAEGINVPDDILTDLIDLLIGGVDPGSKWSLTNLTRNKEKDRKGWADAVSIGKDADVLDEATAWLARRGRARAYSDEPTTRVDKDWLADAISSII